jgi:hypothetical protein
MNSGGGADCTFLLCDAERAVEVFEGNVLTPTIATVLALARTDKTSPAAAQSTFLACPGLCADTRLLTVLGRDILDLVKNIPFPRTVRAHPSPLRPMHK